MVAIKDTMIEKMQAGSVIYDLAAIQGGNTSFTKPDKLIEKNGVKMENLRHQKQIGVNLQKTLKLMKNGGRGMKKNFGKNMKRL